MAISSRSLKRLPLIPADSSLLQQLKKEFPGDVAPVRVGDDKSDNAVVHVRVPTAWKRPLEAKLSQMAHQITATDRADCGHLYLRL